MTGKAKIRRQRVDPTSSLKDQAPNEEDAEGKPDAMGSSIVGGKEGAVMGIAGENKSVLVVNSKRGRVRHRSSLGWIGSAEKLYKPS